MPRQEEAAIAVPATVAAPEKRIEKNRKRAVVAPAGDLRDQIALIDAARTAVKTGLTERALVLLHRYDVSYPAGAFRPEALALRIEALGEGGRAVEAKALAREFLARYPQSPLADRVARAAR
jgi:outer membrane protein assembly factor BamD (BamD/ComL family)